MSQALKTTKPVTDNVRRCGWSTKAGATRNLRQCVTRPGHHLEIRVQQNELWASAGYDKAEFVIIEVLDIAVAA